MGSLMHTLSGQIDVTFDIVEPERYIKTGEFLDILFAYKVKRCPASALTPVEEFLLRLFFSVFERKDEVG